MENKRAERLKEDDSYIPDYEGLFAESEEENGGGIRVLTKLLKGNKGKIMFSSLLYIIKASPVWIIPVITAAIINTVTDGGSNIMARVWTYMGILTLLLAQNIPMHMLYARYTDSMLRTIGAGLRNTLIKKLQHLSIKSFFR